MLKDYFRLFRVYNVAFMAYFLILLKYFLIKFVNAPSFLDNTHFLLMVLTISMIAAAGYLVNNIFDIEIDAVNKGYNLIERLDLSEKKLYLLYYTLNIVALSIGFYISYYVGRINFFFFFVLAAFLLYQYASNLKKVLFVNNLLISFLTALLVLMPVLFDILPALTADNREYGLVVSKVIGVYAIFALLLNWSREIIKDVEDMDGDSRFGVNSIVIKYGVNASKFGAAGINFAVAGFVLYFSYYYLLNQSVQYYYSLVFVLAPLVFSILMILRAKTQVDYSRLSLLLKLIMFFGVSSIFIFTIGI